MQGRPSLMMTKVAYPSMRRHLSCSAALLLLLLPVLNPTFAHTITNRIGLKETDLHQQASDCHQVDEECRSATQETPVCGTNGDTYRSMCHLRRAVCRRDNVLYKHEGECTAAERCLDKRRSAEEDRKKAPGVYVPVCRADGRFEPMQCHLDTGFCWCVSPEGRFTGSTANGARIRELNCSTNVQAGRSTPVESPKSPSSRSPCVPNSRLRRCVQQEGCTVSRRSAFIDNMSKHILNEYSRLPEAAESTDPQRAALIWKFNELDTNSDGQLGRREYRDLKRLVRRNVNPKTCSRLFPVLCDVDENTRVSRIEWQTCWESPLQLLPSPPNMIPGEQETKKRKIKGGRRPGVKRPRGSRRRPANGAQNVTQSVKKKKGGTRASSCQQERQSALRQATGSSSNNAHFVPVCDSRGRFRRYQCYGSLGQGKWYCFCVSVRTGKTLLGTDVRFDTNSGALQCDTMELPAKPWPKCKEPEEARKFLSALLNYLNDFTGGSPSPVGIASADDRQRVVHKLFLKLDENRNNKLDRREKKKLQELVKSERSLKTCGRHIQKVCDADDDGAITSLELRTCLSPPSADLRGRRQPALQGGVSTSTVAEARLMGENGGGPLPISQQPDQGHNNNWTFTNPFETILVPVKED